MYVEESGCFDPSTHVVQHEGVGEDVFAIQQHTYLVAAAALELQFQQLNLEMEQCYNINVTHNNSIQDQMIHDHQPNSSNNNNLLSMFPLPTCPQSSLLPPKSPNLLASQPPLLREFFHSFPHGYDLRNLRSNNNTSFFSDIAKNKDGKETKHFATERQRRMQLNDKYKALKSMVPNPSKNDRASVVKDAIGYINELKRGVNELKLMLEKKRCSRDRIKRQRSEGGGTTLDAKQMDEVEQSYNENSLRNSWLQRRSKSTEVDVWIVDDKVTVKLVQQKRINCLLFASKVLDDLQLDLHHVAGGLIGDYYSFLFNSKISEGSTVYASAIAKKLIEVVDIQYAAIAPTNSY